MSIVPVDDQPLSYRNSGVNIDAGNELVRRIGPAAQKTRRPEVLGGLGHFGALFELPRDQFRNPVLVSGTDGVGTKLKLAAQFGDHRTVGVDLVAMCVNDILAVGAEPLYFLDYFATGRLNVDLATTVVKGIAEGCEMAGCALVGGETAEMPGMYSGTDYDLAGFAVGIVEKERILNPTNVRPGQILLGLGSSGPHSNGYSLIRKILEQSDMGPDAVLGTTTLKTALLAPTRIYVKPLLHLMKSVPVTAIAHITGGGISDNLPRALPDDTIGMIDLDAWEWPAVFGWIQEQGEIPWDEMLRTFNCGIGMILVLDQSATDRAISILQAQGVRAFSMGRIDSGQGRATVHYRHSR